MTERRDRMPDAAELRASFDGAFGRAHVERRAVHAVLAIEVAGRPYAIRVADIAGIFADRAITPLPSRRADVLGLAGFRGALVPVFDLAALLGHAAGPRRWLVIAARTPVGFAFDRLVAHLHVLGDELATGVVRTHETPHPVVDIGPLIDVIATAVGED